MNNLWLTLDFCTEPAILKVILYIQIIIDYAFVIVPIGLILMLGFDIAKNVMASNENDMQKNVKMAIKRIFYCIAMFFVPTIVNLVINVVDSSISNISTDYSSCLENVKEISYYEDLAEKKKEQEESELQKKIEEAMAKVKEEEVIIQYSNSDSDTPSSNTTTATVIGQKYQLTDAQLRGLAIICQREQGTAKGAAAEASLMANQFELFGSSYGTGGAGLYNYVASSGWFGGNAMSYMQNTSSLKPEVLASVKEVLVLGKRTLALYVNEHDCIDCGSYGFDVIKIITDGNLITNHSELKDHSNYKKDNTVIYNRYGSIYTFYTFPTETSDPFGYTKAAKDKYDSLNKGA